MTHVQQLLHRYVFDNPIYHTEYTLLTRKLNMSWRLFFLLCSIGLVGFPYLWLESTYFEVALTATLNLLGFFNGIGFLILVMSTLGVANSSAKRERRNRVWRQLILTNTDNRQVVIGKWLAVIRTQMKDYLWLFGMRVAFIVTSFVLTRYNNSVTTSMTHVNIIFFLFFFTIAELAMSAGIGIGFGYFKGNWSSNLSVFFRMGMAVTLPILTYFGFALLDGDSRYFLIADGVYGENLELFAIRSSTILLDNGMATVFPLTFDVSSVGIISAASVVGLLIYGVITVFMLMVGMRQSYLRGLNLAGVEIGGKSKRKKYVQLEATSETLPHSSHATMSMPHTTRSLFDLADSDLLQVTVYQYQHRFGRLVLRMMSDKEILYVQFSRVAYVEVPTTWRGANFAMASRAEYLDFVVEKQLQARLKDDDTLFLYYAIDAPAVKIIAGDVKIFEEYPV